MAVSISQSRHHVASHSSHHRQWSGNDRQQGYARRELHCVPATADHAAQEPEPARPARHQSVHATAGAVRPGRTAAQIERPAFDSRLAAEVDSADPGARLCRDHGRRRRHDRATQGQGGALAVRGSEAVDGDHQHHEFDGPDGLFRHPDAAGRRAGLQLGWPRD